MDYVVRRDGMRDLEFGGEILASVDQREYMGSCQCTRWRELTIYRTTGGSYVVEEVGRTLWEDEQQAHEAFLCEDASEVVALFTPGIGRDEDSWFFDLAKILLGKAGEVEPSFRGLTVTHVD
jgi:hypothetical protein